MSTVLDMPWSMPRLTTRACPTHSFAITTPTMQLGTPSAALAQPLRPSLSGTSSKRPRSLPPLPIQAINPSSRSIERVIIRLRSARSLEDEARATATSSCVQTAPSGIQPFTFGSSHAPPVGTVPWGNSTSQHREQTPATESQVSAIAADHKYHARSIPEPPSDPGHTPEPLPCARPHATDNATVTVHGRSTHAHPRTRQTTTLSLHEESSVLRNLAEAPVLNGSMTNTPTPRHVVIHVELSGQTQTSQSKAHSLTSTSEATLCDLGTRASPSRCSFSSDKSSTSDDETVTLASGHLTKNVAVDQGLPYFLGFGVARALSLAFGERCSTPCGRLTKAVKWLALDQTQSSVTRAQPDSVWHRPDDVSVYLSRRHYTQQPGVWSLAFATLASILFLFGFGSLEATQGLLS